MLRPYFKKNQIEAGCDEAGRGCLAGPVVAAAVILPANFAQPLLNDSKQLSKKNREWLEPIIKDEAISWAIGLCTPEEIDHINILKASFLAMHRAIEKLKKQPEYLLIDGNRFTPFKKFPFQCVIKGDSIYQSIAAASILAKTHRDRLMETLAADYPEYGWAKNAGYPTLQHRAAIEKFGPTPHHRKSFQLLKGQTSLFG